MHRGRKPAYVSVLGDGTVQVACNGIEMGQGLFTKVAQVRTRLPRSLLCTLLKGFRGVWVRKGAGGTASSLGPRRYATGTGSGAGTDAARVRASQVR